MLGAAPPTNRKNRRRESQLTMGGSLAPRVRGPSMVSHVAPPLPSLLRPVLFPAAPRVRRRAAAPKGTRALAGIAPQRGRRRLRLRGRLASPARVSALDAAPEAFPRANLFWRRCDHAPGGRRRSRGEPRRPRPLRRSARSGGELFVFPEGTSSLGPRHLPFKAGGAQLALDCLE